MSLINDSIELRHAQVLASEGIIVAAVAHWQGYRTFVRTLVRLPTKLLFAGRGHITRGGVDREARGH